MLSAAAPFDWLEFAIVGTLIFAAVTLIRAFLVNDEALLRPSMKKLFMVLPFVVGMVAGAFLWSEGRGLARGAFVYGNFAALSSHALWQGWKTAASMFPALMPQILAQKLGVKLPAATAEKTQDSKPEKV